MKKGWEKISFSRIILSFEEKLQTKMTYPIRQL